MQWVIMFMLFSQFTIQVDESVITVSQKAAPTCFKRHNFYSEGKQSLLNSWKYIQL